MEDVGKKTKKNELSLGHVEIILMVKVSNGDLQRLFTSEGVHVCVCV